MGTIEDIRKAMQDFLAPELRAHGERLKNIESSQAELKTELKEFRSEMRESFKKTEEHIDTRYKELITAMNLEARVKRVEERETESLGALSTLLKRHLDDTKHRLERLEETQQRSVSQKPDPDPGGKWETK
jgi:chromosome segregation ATPase